MVCAILMLMKMALVNRLVVAHDEWMPVAARIALEVVLQWT